MTHLGDVLELLHRSTSSWVSLDIHGHEWIDHEGARAAFEVYRTTYGSERGKDPKSTPRPKLTEVSDQQWRYVRDSNDRGRAEFSVGSEETRVVWHGPTFWSWRPSERTGRTNAGVPNMSYGFGPAETLLAGREVIPDIDLVVRGRGEVAARKVLVAHATPTPYRPNSFNAAQMRLGTGADAYELAVDEERGLLLRVEARLEGSPFRIVEATAVAFDITPLDDLLNPPSEIEFVPFKLQRPNFEESDTRD